MRWVLAVLAAVALAAAATAEIKRPTVVSLDFCADQYVLALADRDQILAVSKDAARPFSYLRARAEGLRQVRAVAEDVLALKPDLVVRSWGGDVRALELYRRFGIGTLQIGHAEDIPGTAEVLREVAARLGQTARAEQLIAAMPAQAPQTERRALYVTPGGISAGNRTLIDSIMTQAGLVNVNEGVGWTSLPLENLVHDPPTLMLTAFFGFEDDRTNRWSVSHHPVMQRLIAAADVVALDEARVSCAGWFAAEEAAAIPKMLDGAE